MLRSLSPFALASVLLIHAASCGGQIVPQGDAGAAVTPSSGSSGSAQGTSGSSGGIASSTSSSGAATSSSGSSSGSGGSGSSSGGTSSGSMPFDAGPCPSVPLASVTNDQTCATDVAGRWAACAGVENLHGFGFNPADTVGLEFGPATMGGGGCGGGLSPCLGGDLYLLVQGATGLVRGQGPDYQIYYACSQGAFWWEQTPNGSSSWSTGMSASTNPRVLDIQSSGYNNGTTLVGIP